MYLIKWTILPKIMLFSGVENWSSRRKLHVQLPVILLGPFLLCQVQSNFRSNNYSESSDW
jgi:hypothetical protein